SDRDWSSDVCSSDLQFEASASGTVDFRDETLDLQIQPRLAVANPIDVSKLAGLVRVRGTLAAPAVTIDTAAAASAIAGMTARSGDRKSVGWERVESA